jgi:hypothetical protein
MHKLISGSQKYALEGIITTKVSVSGLLPFVCFYVILLVSNVSCLQNCLMLCVCTEEYV